MAIAVSAAPRPLGAALVALVLLAAGSAQAQSITTSSAEFNGGWGRAPGSENQPVQVSTRSSNGNRVIVDGLMLTGEDNSSFSSADGAGDNYSGVGSLGGGATAIGNNLVVVTQGNYNTVIVTSTQTNHGDVIANANVGGVGHDD